VHGKRSLLGRMPGGRRQRFANLRAYYSSCSPSRQEAAVHGLASSARSASGTTIIRGLAPARAEEYAGIHSLVRDLNRLYRALPHCTSWTVTRPLRVVITTMATAMCSAGSARARRAFAMPRGGEFLRTSIAIIGARTVRRQVA